VIGELESRVDVDRVDRALAHVDLWRFADTVAAAVGGSVTIEDRNLDLLAYSSVRDEPIDEPRLRTILERRSPTAWRTRLRTPEIADRLWVQGAVVRFPPDPNRRERARIAVAVRVDDELLGSIWVAEGDHPLAPDADVTLQHAAVAARPLLLGHESECGSTRQATDTAIDPAIDALYADSLPTAQRARWVRSSVLAIRLVPPDGIVRHAQARRCANVVATYCEALLANASTTQRGQHVYVVLPEHREPRQLALALVAHVETVLGVPVVAGIGTPSATGDLAAVRREAEQAAETLVPLHHETRAATLDDVHAHRVLLDLAGVADDATALLARGSVPRLRDHDARHGTSYLPTLSAVLNQRNMTSAAASLGIHVNTLRYRVRRLTEVSGLDLDDADARLVAALELRLLELSAEREAPAVVCHHALA
jgi:DNA-binding PucR family transcriptional regulator